MGFFSRLRDVAKNIVISRRQREATERFKRGLARGADRGAGTAPGISQRVEIPEEILEDEIDSDFYEVDEAAITVVDRPRVPGPDPSKLSSGDLLATAAFYGVTDEEYTELERMIDIAYNDPASTPDERRQAINQIQDAMNRLHARSRESEDFDWARWREEVYPRGRRGR